MQQKPKKINDIAELKEIVKNKYNPWKVKEKNSKYLNHWATICTYLFENKKTYTILQQPNSVHIVAITDKNEIVLQIRRFRPGVFNKPTLELVAGYIDNNDPEQTAISELQEEIGANITNIQSMSSTIYKPDAVSSSAYGFVARIKDFSAKNIDKEEQEEFDIILMDMKTFVENIITLQESMSAPDVLFAIQAYYQWIIPGKI